MNPPPLPVRKRFPWILYWIALVLIVLFAFAPIGSVVACAWIANTHGCKVDEGSVHPLHHRRSRLWPASLYAGSVGLVDARYSSRWFVRICCLVGHSHPSSWHLAKTICCRFAADLPFAIICISRNAVFVHSLPKTAFE